jgi:hypothetical protein
MTEDRPQAVEPRQVPSAEAARNPYIVNFCKVLVEKKGEELEAEVLKKLLDDMYKLFECMLGQNMVNSLPEDLRKHYLSLTEDLAKLDYEKIGEIFDKNVPDYERVMKETMKQFADIYMRNRVLDPRDYPVPVDTCLT